MYKIYINERPLVLLSREAATVQPPGTPSELVDYFGGKTRQLLSIIDNLEKSGKLRSVTLLADDVEALKEEVLGLYRIVEAAGGVVENPAGEVLLIFRRGHWDLPKGKIDPEETIEAAALREVEEETGVQHLQLGAFLGETYHSYAGKDNARLLKKTYWYEMRSPACVLVPQVEEDIEKAVWADLGSFFKTPKPVYGNISDVLARRGH